MDCTKKGIKAIIPFFSLIFLIFFSCNEQAKEVVSLIPNSITHVPTRVITQGPGHHWFGKYDKLEFDPTGRYVLAAQVGFEGRSPQSDDTIWIGMVDLLQNDQWTELGTSVAWGWQQGYMLQFIPRFHFQDRLE